MAAAFDSWLDVFLSEKRVALETPIVVAGPSGPNHMTVEVVVEAMKATGADEQAILKRAFVHLDFVNGDVLDYLNHLAKALAV